VVKPELGTKRVCPNCGTKYYDLNRDPIICPKCGTRFEMSGVRATRAPAPAPVPEPEEEEEAIVGDLPPDADLVPLEEADDEAADTGAVKVDADDETADDEAEDPFLEEEEEEDGDVSDIIGGVDEEEP